MRAALDDAAASLSSEGDEARRVRALTGLLSILEDEISKVSGLRNEAIAKLRAGGSSYQQIALRTGLSKSRVAQLCRAEEA